MICVNRLFCSLNKRSFHTPSFSRKISTFQALGKSSWSVSEAFLSQDQTKPSEDSHISQEDIKRLAALSMLEIPKTSEELARLQKDIRSMLWCVQRIQQIDTSNVEPLSSVLEKYPLRTRQDVANPQYFLNENDYPQILRTAQQTHASFFVVPKQKIDSDDF
jgi:aspartyl/glutamyl-tRNA(Asn/Gln) amidotransferase C subunit